MYRDRIILRRTVVAEDTEYSIVLPPTTRRVRVFNESKSERPVRVSFATGEVATGGASITRNRPYDTGQVSMVSQTLYYAGAIPGLKVLIEVEK